MPVAIHPSAAQSANTLAVRILDGAEDVIPEPSVPMPAGVYQPAVPIAFQLTDSDIKGPVVKRLTDRFGQETERIQSDATGGIRLRGVAHADFLKLGMLVQKQPGLRDAVSLEIVLDEIFDWIWQTRRQGPTVPLCDHVLFKCEARIDDRDVIVPIFGLHVEIPLLVGRVTFADITESEMGAWRERMLRQAPAQADGVAELNEKLRRKLLGRAAARFRISAEESHAKMRALDETGKSLAVLRLCSAGAFAPERPTTIAVLGEEYLAHATTIMLGAGDSFHSSESMLHPTDLDALVLDTAAINGRILPFIKPWSSLLQREKRSRFEDTAFKSMLLYSRATQYRNISEKLIHIFSAVEALLLKSETEPIMGALAERLAFVVGQTAAERQDIAKTVRAVYGMRSRYVHHAADAPTQGEDLRIMEKFLVTVSQFFFNLGTALSQYATCEEFLEALERRKYE